MKFPLLQTTYYRLVIAQTALNLDTIIKSTEKILVQIMKICYSGYGYENMRSVHQLVRNYMVTQNKKKFFSGIFYKFLFKLFK